MPKSSYAPHARSRDAWRKFSAWYGIDVVERRYGTDPPEDWDRVLRRLDRDKMAAVLADVKNEHSSFMPSLGDFERIVERHAPSNVPRGPSLIERLASYAATRAHPSQGMQPWTYQHIGHPGGPGQPHSPDYQVIAVVIPEIEAYGKLYPELRITVAEMLKHEGEQEQRVKDAVHSFGQRALFQFLRSKEAGATRKSLDAMVKAKNEICAAYRETPAAHRERPRELADVLLARFEKLYKPVSTTPLVDKFLGTPARD